MKKNHLLSLFFATKFSKIVALLEILYYCLNIINNLYRNFILVQL